jgi:hypothetical protein
MRRVFVGCNIARSFARKSLVLPIGIVANYLRPVYRDANFVSPEVGRVDPNDAVMPEERCGRAEIGLKSPRVYYLRLYRSVTVCSHVCSASRKGTEGGREPD